MDCLGKCRQGAISFSRKPAAVEPATLKAAVAAGGTGRCFAPQVPFAGRGHGLCDGQGAGEEGRRRSGRDRAEESPPAYDAHYPPGSLAVRNMEAHCTGCQLCVAVCPNQVLRPSGKLMSLMVPEMSYERGYCRPECTKCSEVCPTGAIRPITKEDKSSVQIGPRRMDRRQLCRQHRRAWSAATAPATAPPGLSRWCIRSPGSPTPRVFRS